MGILDTVKEAVSLIQKVDNIDLYRRMLELQTQAISLVEENRSLKEQLTTRASLKFEKNAYSMNGEWFCSACWDKDTKLVHLRIPSRGTQDSPWCPVCLQNAADPDRKPTTDDGRAGERQSPWG